MTTLSFVFCLILLSEFLDIYEFYMEYILNAKKTKVSCESKYKFVET